MLCGCREEIQYTMSSHGMSIDARHTMLLADCMSYKVCATPPPTQFLVGLGRL